MMDNDDIKERVAAFMAKRQQMKQLLDAAETTKLKYEKLLQRDGGPVKTTLMQPDTVAARNAYNKAAEAVFLHDKTVETERDALIELGFLKPRRRKMH